MQGKGAKTMPVVILQDRGVVQVSGQDARAFLQGLVSCDMGKISPQLAGFGALLSPQGKILFDFFIYEQGEAFLLDCPLEMTAALAKRLGFYKLRAKVLVEDMSGAFGIEAGWDDAPRQDYGTAKHGWRDPRLAAMGWRRVVARGTGTIEMALIYAAHRIAQGVPEGGADFVYGDTFPHEANMDLLGGVDFHKGCYVGQEVVARMQHKTAVRKRVVPVSFNGLPPDVGAEVKAGDLVIGRMGASVAAHGLALLRLDRVEEAQTRAIPLTVDGQEVEVLALPYGAPQS